jgi:hypothetical protein
MLISHERIVFQAKPWCDVPAVVEPLRICSRTGTVGGTNETPLTVKSKFAGFYRCGLRSARLRISKETDETKKETEVNICAVDVRGPGLYVVFNSQSCGLNKATYCSRVFERLQTPREL